MTDEAENTETVEITPLSCYGPWLHCPDAHAWMLQLSPLAIVVVCALFARRWIDLPLVALVAVLGSIAAIQLELIIAHGAPEWPGPMHVGEYAQQNVLLYFVALALAVVTYCIKLAVRALSARLR